MKLQHRHIIGLGLWCVLLLGFASCINESFELLHEEEEENSIYLTFHTAVAGVSTRVDEIPDDARINQLRVVIVSENDASEEENTPEGEDASEGEGGNTNAAGKRWVVEHSRLVKGTSNIGLPLTDEYTFKVRAGCRKRIYLLANCAELKDSLGVKIDFSNSSFIPKVPSGTSAKETGKAPIDDFVFSLSNAEGGYQYDLALGIPMTAMYEIEIPNRKDIGKDEFSIPTPLYVIRAATKFSFSFANRSSRRNIEVTGFSLTKAVNDRMYLMPHVNRNEDGRYWVVDSERERAISLPEIDVPDVNHKVTEWDWINWMVAEAEKTEEDKNIEKYQWLTDYDIPTTDDSEGESGEEVSLVSVNFKKKVTLSAITAGNAEKPVSVEPFYLPESRTLATTGTEEGGTVDPSLKLQEYELTVYTKETFLDEKPEGSDAEWRVVERKYTARLEHLASLFRNTHVKVNIGFNDYTLDWKVDVEPYWAVELDPVFGLDDPKKND
ncbi:hypothetical protein [uncultured Bacteroides sp.]|uniref:hypothetical protein n=1 Tax=uncultured Bacteroides sp. TaxID=162156 RepID=UPI00261F9E93|nr:hypothetical protein [uncultured Bacteroides sp.]